MATVGNLTPRPWSWWGGNIAVVDAGGGVP